MGKSMTLKPGECSVQKLGIEMRNIHVKWRNKVHQMQVVEQNVFSHKMKSSWMDLVFKNWV